MKHVRGERNRCVKTPIGMAGPTSVPGTKLPTRDIRYTAAFGGKPNMTRTAQFGWD